MNLPKPKKYIGLSLILASLFLVHTTGAQSVSGPEDLDTLSTPTLTEEPITPVASSSNPSTTSAATRTGATLDENPREALSAVRQTRITNLAANISNRMDAAVERLANISLRLEQRIVKMEEAGLETSLARERLVSANETLAMAQLKLSDIDSLVNGATFSTNPRSNWQTVRERYQEVGSLIRQAHFALRESINFLKNPSLKKQKAATSSNEINPESEELIFN